MESIKLNRHGLFNQRWAWTGLEVKNVLKSLATCKQPSLHVCSGCSAIGDVRLDRVMVGEKTHIKTAMPEYRGKANILGNMIELPFKNASFNTVICDPPYDHKWIEDGVIYTALIDEIVRVTKPKGIIIFYAPIVLTHPTIKLVETEYSQMGKRCYFKILSTSTKVNSQISDYC